MADKKARGMTVKGFLSKAAKQGAGSAMGFIAQHREWLEAGTLGEVTKPILVQLDARQVYPTPALEMLSAVVLGHHYAQAQVQHEAAQEVSAEAAPRVSSKKWVATIYNAEGVVQTRINAKGEDEELTKAFDLDQDANRWCDRRLFDGAPDWFGVVASTCMVDGNGDAIATVIMRQDAIARILRKPFSAPVVRQPPKGGSRLSFGIKNAKTTRVEFSRG